MNPTPQKIVAVTGAAGGLGSALVRELKAKEFSVRALILPTDSPAKISAYCDEVRMGSVEDFETCRTLLKDCVAVFNCAALLPNSLETVPAQNFYSVNEEGGKNIFRAARELRLSQAFFISTIGVVDHTGLINKNQLFNFRSTYLDPYSSSKIKLEQFLRAHQSASPTKTIVVRPAFIYGPHSTSMWNLIMEQIHSRSFKILGNGNAFFPIVFDEDLAKFLVHQLCAPCDVSNPLIVAGPHDISTRELFSLLATELKVKAPGTVPISLAFFVAGIADLLPPPLKWGPLKLLSKRRVKEYSKGYDLSLVNTPQGNWFTPPRIGINQMVKSWGMNRR